MSVAPIVMSRDAGQLFAQKNGMRHETHEALNPVVLLAAASGARTSSGVAALFPGPVTRLWAFGELIVDKLPSVPDRIGLGPLAGRVIAGASLGAIVGGRTGTNRAQSAMVGALIAFASAHASYRMRRMLSRVLPSMTAALLEDAIVLAGAAAGAAMVPRG
jgi:uncharacterized membrane protein